MSNHKLDNNRLIYYKAYQGYTMLKHVTVTIISLLAAGCSTVTMENVNTLPVNQPQVSTTLQQPEFKGLKRKVAIARFSNETSAGASYLLDNKNDRIGKQASDILAARLTETNKFIMLERIDLDKIHSEAALSNLSKVNVGADYLIIGSVSEYGRKDESDVGIFSRNKKQRANVKVNVRLVDVTTGQIIFSQEGSGEAFSEANTMFGVGGQAGYDTSLDDKALSAAITKLVSNIIETLMDKPWQAYLIAQQGALYIMTGGKSQGVKIHDTFSLLQKGKIMHNPQTGLNIELPGKQVGKLLVVAQSGQGDNEISLCEITEGSIKELDLKTIIVREAY